jgi:protein-disulfide isomerase
MSHKSSRQRVSGRRAQRRKAQTRLFLGVSVGAVVLVGGLILLSILSAPKPALGAEDLARYEGLAQSVDRSGAVGYAIGDPDAPVTLVEYSDFSCGHCRDLSETVDVLIDEYAPDGKLRVVYKPVTFVNPAYSVPAAQAAICAGEQGRFWEMHAHIWTLSWANGPQAYAPRTLTPLAESLGLDMDRYKACLNSPETGDAIQGVLDEARQMGIQGTPAIYVNGQQVGYTGAETAYGRLVEVVESELDR